MTDTLTQADIETLGTIAGLMIPASATHSVPGADTPDILAEIVEDANKTGPQNVIAALKAWREISTSDDADRVKALQSDPAGHAAVLQTIVTRVYYRNDTVMQSLGMEARAPFPKGFEVEEHDWSILDPVRARDPIWRAAK